MITFISGAPGTGKTAALVSMLRDLSKDRAIFVHGIPELKIPHTELEKPDNWHNDVPDGSVIVIDEVQNVWRPRGPGQKVPDNVAKLETHRHRGLDFYIISQGPNLVDGNVRALIGRHVHLRELGVLGRWWYEWPECADNCRTAWKNAPIKKRYRLPKKNFKDYKSSSLHVKPIRSFPWMLVVMVAALGGVAYKSWDLYNTIMSKGMPTPLASGAKPSGGPTVTGLLTGDTAGLRSVSGNAPKVIDDRVDWLPRISSRPETAPAYDELRKVAVLPRIAAGYVKGREVRCYTQQGTRVDITDDECRAWLANPPFDAYSVPLAVQAAAALPSPQNPLVAQSGPSLVTIEGVGWRDPQGAQGTQGGKR
jgi:zona occludens toxin